MPLRCHNLWVKVADRTLCRELELVLEPGQFWGLLGPNGCGKTLLLHTLAGLRPAAQGQILLDHRRLDTLPRRRVAQRLGLLFQETPPSLPATVLETVVTGRHPHLRPWHWEQPADFAIAHSALRDVALEGFEHRDATSLSGGERQRVAIATLLVQEPTIYLLDEPTNHLDLAHQLQIMGLFRELANQGRGVLASLHDLNLALRFCDHLILLRDGEPISGPTDCVGNAPNLSRLYGHPLEALAGPAGPVMVPA